MKALKRNFYIPLIFLATLLGSCTALKTAPFDQYSYQNTIAIKVDAARLMDKATTPYTENEVEVEEVKIALEKMLIYEQNKPNNGISYEMWKLLSDDDKNLLAGFLKRWKEKGTFSPIFLQESKAQVTEAFDILIRYEGKKDKETKQSLLDLILTN